MEIETPKTMIQKLDDWLLKFETGEITPEIFFKECEDLGIHFEPMDELTETIKQ